MMMNAYDTIYRVRMFLLRLILPICSWLCADYPSKVQDARAGWQFNNNWKQPVVGEKSEPTP